MNFIIANNLGNGNWGVGHEGAGEAGENWGQEELETSLSPCPQFSLSPSPLAQSPIPNLYASCGSSSNIDIHRRLEKEEKIYLTRFQASKAVTS
ncbi:hypothetical protein ACEYW6_21125 [Nostoc sp. UIC 10607]|uniref:hypothetical protein n=1 Tax=Nostoc sp. UIC 10607 TaxID=3045935 RepID=UPI00399F77AE